MITEGFSSYEGFNAQLVRWRYEALRPYFRGRTCLELGSADGQGTEYLLRAFAHVTAVDGDESATRRLRSLTGSGALHIVTSMFEDLDLDERFSTVVAAHVLEHVDDPQQLLSVARRHVEPGGVLVVDVPNALSLHRRLGVAMGMLPTVTTLNDADLSIGHQRVYTPDAFLAELAEAGLHPVHVGGVFLKVLSNAQTEEVFDERQLEGFRRLGEEDPLAAAEIFAVCQVLSGDE